MNTAAVPLDDLPEEFQPAQPVSRPTRQAVPVDDLPSDFGSSAPAPVVQAQALAPGIEPTRGRVLPNIPGGRRLSDPGPRRMSKPSPHTVPSLYSAMGAAMSNVPGANDARERPPVDDTFVDDLVRRGMELTVDPLVRGWRQSAQASNVLTAGVGAESLESASADIAAREEMLRGMPTPDYKADLMRRLEWLDPAGKLTPEEFQQGLPAGTSQQRMLDALPPAPTGVEALSNPYGAYYGQRENMPLAKPPSLSVPEVAWEYAKDPRNIVDLALESGSASLASILTGMGGGAAAGAVTANPIGIAAGAALGAGGGSFAQEFGSDVLNTFRKNKVDLSKPEEVLAAFQNPELMAQAREHAAKRGASVALFDALSAGVAGRAAKPIERALGGGKAAPLIGEVGEIGVQAGLGGAGEAAGSMAVGEKVDPIAVTQEMLGEMGPGLAEILYGRYQHEAAKKKKKAGQPDPFDLTPPTEEAAAAAQTASEARQAEAEAKKSGRQTPFISGFDVPMEPVRDPNVQPELPLGTIAAPATTGSRDPEGAVEGSAPAPAPQGTATPLSSAFQTGKAPEPAASSATPTPTEPAPAPAPAAPAVSTAQEPPAGEAASLIALRANKAAPVRRYENDPRGGITTEDAVPWEELQGGWRKREYIAEFNGERNPVQELRTPGGKLYIRGVDHDGKPFVLSPSAEKLFNQFFDPETAPAQVAPTTAAPAPQAAAPAAPAPPTSIETAQKAKEPTRLELPNPKKGWKGVPDAEIEVHPVEGGFKVSYSHFTPTGGNATPVQHSKVYPTREAAIAHAAEQIRKEVPAVPAGSPHHQKGENGKRKRIRDWLDTVAPVATQPAKPVTPQLPPAAPVAAAPAPAPTAPKTQLPPGVADFDKFKKERDRKLADRNNERAYNEASDRIMAVDEEYKRLRSELPLRLSKEHQRPVDEAFTKWSKAAKAGTDRELVEATKDLADKIEAATEKLKAAEATTGGIPSDQLEEMANEFELAGAPELAAEYRKRAAEKRKEEFKAASPPSREPTGGDQVTPQPYGSGMSRPGDFRAAVASPIGAGVVATELSATMIEQVAAAVAAGKEVFVDSGAFSAFKAAMKAGKPNATKADFDKVFTKYNQLIEKVKERTTFAQRGLLTVVAPDVVGDQTASLALLRKHADEVKQWMEDGFEVIVPFQRGPLPQSEVYKQVAEILGGNDFVVGVPSNAAALNNEEFAELLSQPYKPDRIHILGAVNSPRVEERMKVIREAYKDEVPGVTTDANLIRSKTDELRGLKGEDRVRAIKDILERSATTVQKALPPIEPQAKVEPPPPVVEPPAPPPQKPKGRAKAPSPQLPLLDAPKSQSTEDPNDPAAQADLYDAAADEAEAEGETDEAESLRRFAEEVRKGAGLPGKLELRREPKAKPSKARVGEYTTTREGEITASRQNAIWTENSLNPTHMNQLPPPERYARAAELVQKKFGFKAIIKAKNLTLGDAIDIMKDAYVGLTNNAAVFNVNSPFMSVMGTITLELIREVPGRPGVRAYYDPSTKTIAIVRRNDSYTHELGHAIDHWLLEQFAPDLMMEKGQLLTGKIRSGGGKPATMDALVRDRFIAVLNAMFFDQAGAALYVMDLQAKIAAAKTAKQKAKWQTQLDNFIAGHSKKLGIESDYYIRAKGFDGKGSEGDDSKSYWQKPTEMFARLFEAFTAHKIQGLRADHPFVTKSDKMYNENRVGETLSVFPQGAERDNMFALLDELVGALRDRGLVPTGNAPAAIIPTNQEYWKPQLPMLSPQNAAKTRNVLRKVADDTKDAYEEFKRADSTAQRRSERNKRTRAIRLGTAQRSALNRLTRDLSLTVIDGYNAMMSGWAHTIRAVMLSIDEKYPGNHGLPQLIQWFSRNPGSGKFQGPIVMDEVRVKERVYQSRLGSILEKHKAFHFTTEERMQMRDVLVNSIPSTAVDSKVAAVCEDLRHLLDDMYVYNASNGVNIGYAKNGFLPRIIDTVALEDDPTGFHRQARGVYSIVYDKEIGSTEELMADPRKLGSLLAYVNEIAKFGRLPENQTAAENLKPLGMEIMELLNQLEEEDADTETLTEALEAKVDELRAAMRPVWASEAANDWFMRLSGFGAKPEWEFDRRSVASDYTKSRVLPPETDTLMKDFLKNDAVELITTYISQAVRRVEFGKAFGNPEGNKPLGWKLDAAKQAMQEPYRVKGGDMHRVDPDDAEEISKSIDMMLGFHNTSITRRGMRWINGLVGFYLPVILARSFRSQVMEGLGASRHMGLLAGPHVVLKQLDNLLSMTGDILESSERFTKHMQGVLKYAGIKGAQKRRQFRRELGEYMGIVTHHLADNIMATKYNVLNQNTTDKLRLARYFYVMGIHPHQMGIRNALGEIFMTRYGPALAKRALGTGARAKLAQADLAELGIDSGNKALLQELMSLADIKSTAELAKLRYLDTIRTATARKVTSVSPEPTAADKPMRASSPEFAWIYALQGFNMAFARDYLIAGAKRINRAWDNNPFLGVGVGASMAAGLAILASGQLAAWIAGVLAWDDDDWEGKKKKIKDQWVHQTITRTSLYGGADPLVNAFTGMKFQKDVANTALGPVAQRPVHMLQAAGNLVVRNNDYTPTSEYLFAKAAWDNIVSPLGMAQALKVVGNNPYIAAAFGISVPFLTSPAFVNPKVEAGVEWATGQEYISQREEHAAERGDLAARFKIDDAKKSASRKKKDDDAKKGYTQGIIPE